MVLIQDGFIHSSYIVKDTGSKRNKDTNTSRTGVSREAMRDLVALALETGSNHKKENWIRGSEIVSSVVDDRGGWRANQVSNLARKRNADLVNQYALEDANAMQKWGSRDSGVPISNKTGLSSKFFIWINSVLLCLITLDL